MRFPRRALAETNENGGLTVRTELPWQSHKIACALGRFEATSKRFSSDVPRSALVRALRRELGGVNAHLLVIRRNSEQARCFDDPEHDGGEDASPERDDDALVVELLHWQLANGAKVIIYMKEIISIIQHHKHLTSIGIGPLFST